MDFGLLVKALPTWHYCGKESEVLSARSSNLAPVFKDFGFGTIAPTENTKVDVDLDDLLHTIASPFLHGVGSVSVSGCDAGWEVVVRAKETTSLCVVDASVSVSGSL